MEMDQFPPEFKGVGLVLVEGFADVLVHPFKLALGEFQGGVRDGREEDYGV